MKKIWILAAASAYMSAATSLQADLVVNGNFDTPAVAQGTTPSGWSKSSSTGIFVENTSDGIGNSADATLTGGGAGVTIAAQLISTLVPSQQYALTFSDYVSPVEPNINPIGNGQTAVNGILIVDQLIVSLDSAPSQTITYDQLSTSTFASGHYQTFTLYFTDVTSPGSLSFKWISSELSPPPTGTEQQNIQLDNISLNAVTSGNQSAVPEPSTIISGGLLLLPLGLGVARILRKKLVVQS
jgi:hypothetical protein